MLPKEIIENIYYFYIPMYKDNMRQIHEDILNLDKIIYNRKLKKVMYQMKTEKIYLELTEVFEFDLDFIFAIRLPRLI